jgi:hypothetical protein
MFHSGIQNHVSNIELVKNRDVVTGNDILPFTLNALKGNDNDNYLITRRLPNCPPRRPRTLRDISKYVCSCNLCTVYYSYKRLLS